MQTSRAFTDEMVSRLTDLSVGQLRSWDRSGFYSPSLAEDNRSLPYSRVYNFRDVVSLRVISALKNEHKVSTQHLKKVAHHLQALGTNDWANTRLYVLNKQVVFDHPAGTGRQEIVSGQRVFEIPLRVATKEAETDIEKLFGRDPKKIGTVDKSRFIMNGEAVVGGTRIPVRTIQTYFDMGLSDERILADYPSIESRDLDAVRQFLSKTAA